MKQRGSQELNKLRQRVEGWREEHGGRGSLVPDELWSAAVEVARLDGVWATARALHFNYARLRERVDRAKGVKGGRGKTPRVLAVTADGQERGPFPRRNGEQGCGNGRSPFVALEMGQLGGAGRTVIELLGRHGDRMRVDVAGGADLVAVVQTFWSRQP